MGIGFVLLIWAVVGAVVAGVGVVCFGGVGWLLTREVVEGRKKFIWVASLFPLACLVWVGGIFIAQAVVNEVVFHRDPGLGDTWTTPLPNGYAVLMIDMTDQGYVYNPKTQPGDVVAGQEDAVGGVKVLQVAGPFILGGADARGIEERPKRDDSVNFYFVLDTRSGTQSRFADLQGLKAYAEKLGVTVDLASIYSVYAEYRSTWFDYLALFFL